MGNKGPLAGKVKKAVSDQYQMKMGKGLPPKESYKKRVLPPHPAEDSTDEPETAEEMDNTTQAPPSQVKKQLTGNSHRVMHQAMNALEDPESNSNDATKNMRGKGIKPKNHPGDAPRNSKKLSMF